MVSGQQPLAAWRAPARRRPTAGRTRVWRPTRCSAAAAGEAVQRSEQEQATQPRHRRQPGSAGRRPTGRRLPWHHPRVPSSTRGSQALAPRHLHCGPTAARAGGRAGTAAAAHGRQHGRCHGARHFMTPPRCCPSASTLCSLRSWEDTLTPALCMTAVAVRWTALRTCRLLAAAGPRGLPPAVQQRRPGAGARRRWQQRLQRRRQRQRGWMTGRCATC